ncbi:MAG: hypothetical protein ACREO7_10495 [Pseudoxanthomonas sp.]
MNAMQTIQYPLPSILYLTPSSPMPGRRKSIGQFRLNSLDLDRFNRLLGRLGRSQAPLVADQVVTAARELNQGNGQADPPCIVQRIRIAKTVAEMVADTAWMAASTNDSAIPARLVADYLQEPEGLIPGWLPQIGHLDEAIVVETAWPRLADEVEGYVDFRRLRRIEADLRGCAENDFRFDRNDWLEERRVEVALKTQRCGVRENSYLPTPCAMFRIH